jgi:hypothetical protein
LRYVEDQLVEEPDEGVAETRGVDSGNEVLQVLACPFEEKNGESGENSACERKWTLEGVIGGRVGILEFDRKGDEFGQGGQARCIRDLVESKLDKVTGRQEKLVQCREPGAFQPNLL